jgi:hypothetical protein
MPVDVTVDEAIGAPVRRTVDAPGGGRAEAWTWRIPIGRVEVRWPAAPRVLYERGTSTAVLRAMDVVEGSDDGRSLTAHSQDPLTVAPGRSGRFWLQLALKAGVAAMPGRPCDKIEVRFTALDGRSQTVGFRVDHDASAFDLDPLIGDTVAVPGPLAAGASFECAQDTAPRAAASPAATVAVARSASSASPAEALRRFLASPAGEPLDVPMPRRPFTEYRVAADGSYRYEHYTNWDEHASITVARSADGWAVSAYRTGC